MYISESSVSKGKYVKFSPYTLWHTSFPLPKKKKGSFMKLSAGYVSRKWL